MEDIGNVVAALIGIVWFVLPLILRALRSRTEQAPSAPSPVLDFAGLSRTVQHALALCDWIALETQRLSKRVVAALGPARVLSDVLLRLSEEQARLRSDVEAAADDVQARRVPTTLPDTLALLDWQRLRLAAVEHMIDVRSDRVLGEMMADADAVAAAHLRPLVEFTQSRGIAFPSRRPVCVPAMPGHEAVFFGLLPEGYPTVFVPSDFGDDLLRWPAVSHEIGHVVWREMPGFARELRRSLALEVEPLIPAGPRSFDLRRCYGAWLEELFCDFFAVVLLGPPALRGMTAMFASEAREDLVWAVAREARYDDHPPPQLRIQLAAHALWVMGFDAEAKQLLREWSAQVGEQPMYGFRALMTPPFGIPSQAVEAFGRTVVERMHEHQFHALHGYSLPVIPGLAMTPGLWAQVRAEKDALIEGQVRHKDPRVILAAAIEARASSSRPSRSMAKAVARAIVGIDEPRRREAPPEPEHDAPGVRDEALQAMVLYQVLARRPRGGRQIPKPGSLRARGDRL
jgi:hypothetical protein